MTDSIFTPEQDAFALEPSDAFIQMLDQQQRTVLRITPQSATMMD